MPNEGSRYSAANGLQHHLRRPQRRPPAHKKGKVIQKMQADLEREGAWPERMTRIETLDLHRRMHSWRWIDGRSKPLLGQAMRHFMIVLVTLICFLQRRSASPWKRMQRRKRRVRRRSESSKTNTRCDSLMRLGFDNLLAKILGIRLRNARARLLNPCQARTSGEMRTH